MATRIEELGDLTETIVAAFTAGNPYLPAVAELCARCDDAGIDHAALLNDVARRNTQAV